MTDEIKVCVNARTDFFGKYVTVPPALQPEVDRFLESITQLGEACANAGEFEQKFQSTGLSNVFNRLVTGCTPQAYTMTAEDKAHSRQVSKELFREQKAEIIKDVGKDALETVQMKAESQLRTARIRQMSEAGVLDEYTRAQNVIEDVGIVGRFLKRKFKKEK